jgi:NAD(P)-dependent dehydrogenase (short-subunit alcohol dehydrogenase family)
MLTGKVAIVTGPSRGIGQTAVLELARGGAAALLTARTGKACEQAPPRRVGASPSATQAKSC